MRGVAHKRASTSSGWSISKPIPGNFTTVGSMARARAAARCGRKLSSPKRSGITRGGEQSTAFEPRSSRAGTIVSDGDGRLAVMTAAISGCRDARNIARHSQHCFPALCRKDTCHGGDRAGVAVACAVRHDAGAVASGQFRREWIERVDHDSRQRCLGECRQHVLQHRRSQRLALLRCQQWGQALLGAGEFLHRHRRPDIRCHRSRRSTRAAPRTMRASASRSARVLISVCPSVTLALMPAT